ncbi:MULTISPECIES: HAD-IIA family hydrolase [Rhodococcus]|uniref:HAD-IIA family hydrolase n=1 Tax=Rhodococcus opacus TaxID=37919 RepID=A0AAX3Y8E1_RHOOP|nr:MULTISPECIES: HAD-IIA family hydrolase [Rhodococcus]NHU47630.1 HAD-IIA family hydrolase [Rhodococcus sp. A14]MBA8964351.1 HAD superfamily hydrolase (TIGR01450 family) [Rhodococcus opacus]MBP2207686.1 HAD superfamily hydrolase (TIGR01450 family) [Rhodococcus opacus]MCZ4590319.1 HAD-IIA family hydrolase [Rhodococcus opacus]MDI9939434.1 HAD-IIA family hydrolase [Rhodococcus sp. IEGM 1351]
MTALRDGYDALLLDLDGTLYQGPQEIPGAREALAAGEQSCYYVTNNASRRPGEVAEHLTELGFDADESTVVTSSQTAARLLAENVAPGSPVLIVGTEALADEIRHVGLRPVRSFEDAPAAVVQGHSPATDWAILAEATLAIRAGAVWVAANLDTTLPTERGLVLGNGSMVAALRTATSREPLVAGKPAAPLMEDAMRRSKCVRPLVVGDRLDTDIEGANNVGLDSLLVLTGVSTAVDVLRAAPEQRPTYLASELDALNRPAEESLIGEDNRWSVEFDGSDLVIEPTSESAAPVDSAALLRAVTAGAWKFPDFSRITSTTPTVSAVVSGWGA